MRLTGVPSRLAGKAAQFTRKAHTTALPWLEQSSTAFGFLAAKNEVAAQGREPALRRGQKELAAGLPPANLLSRESGSQRGASSDPSA